MTNEEALAAYMAAMEQVKAKLARLQQWADDMGEVSPDDVNWAGVGDVDHVYTLLAEAESFISVVELEEE
jgi:hypothetical protein